MALIIADRVQETTNASGTSDYVLLGAKTGFQSFGAVMANADTTYYAVTNGTDWEVGIGTYSTTGPTMARTTILSSSNGGAAVSWAAGTKDIFLSYAAERSVYLDETGDLSVDGTTFFVDAANNRIGIGTLSPAAQLHVAGNTTNIVTLSSSSISGTTMTVGTASSNAIAVGNIVYGVGVAPITKIVSQDSGTAGGAGTYTVSVSQTVASGTMYTGPGAVATIRVANTDTSVVAGQPEGTIEFFGSDVNTPGAGVGAYISAISEDSSPDTALTFGTRDADGGGVDANERMRITSTGIVVFGNGFSSATPASATLQGTDGSGTDIEGAALTIRGGRGTGSGEGGRLVFATAPAGTTGTTLNATVERMRITSAGNVGIGTTSPASIVGGTDTSPVLSIGGTDSVLVTGDKAGSVSFITNDPTYTVTYADGVTSEIASVSEAAGGSAYGLAFYTGQVTDTNRAERMRITSAGNVLQGTTSAITGAGGVVSVNQVAGTTSASGRAAFVYSATNTAAPVYEMGKSANATVGSHTLVDDGEELGTIRWSGSDGTNFIRAAEIVGIVNGTPGTNDMPGALTFGTTADGGTAPTERMRIDSSGNVGIGTSSPGYLLHVQADASPTIASTDTTNTITTIVNSSNTAGVLGTATNHPLALVTNNTERMRIDSSGNVGIGTTSPSYRLDVGGTGRFSSDVDIYSGSGGAINSSIQYFGSAALPRAAALYSKTDTATAGNLVFATAQSGTGTITERARIDASGNLGLGVTPSAWGGTSKALQFSTGGIEARSSALSMNTNAFFNGTSWIYSTSANAVLYNLTNTGQHQWYTAPSGTAGNAITFTQAMTLDASSNLTVAGNVTAYSDARLKTNVRTVPDALGLVQKMRGVFFDKDDTPSVGVIAQEMEEVLPEVVHDGEYKSVAYGNIVGVLIEAIKAQQAQIDELKAKLGV